MSIRGSDCARRKRRGIHSNGFGIESCLVSRNKGGLELGRGQISSSGVPLRQTTWMPLATSRLEILQVRKLIQCVREQDSPQIAKLVELGIYGVIDYQGNLNAPINVLPHLPPYCQKVGI